MPKIGMEPIRRKALTDAAIEAIGARGSMDGPNILILMVDQLNGTLFPDGPADWLHAPNLKALAERSVRLSNNYTASPLCAPGGRASCRGSLAAPHAGL
jgi:choline-sulfatase